MGVDCVPLTVRRVAVEGVNGPYPGFVSEWFPTERELELLNAGQPARMLLLGERLVPSNLWVREVHEL